MAERLDKLPDGGKNSRRYPWDEWTDGSAWLVQKGVDFDVELHAMRAVLYQRALKMGMKVQTRQVDEGELAFQFLMR